MERGPAEQPGGMGITPSPLSPTKFLKFCGTRFGATPSWKEGERKVPSYRGTGPRKNVPSFRGNAESPRCCRELVCGKTDGIPLFSGMTVRICGMMIAIAALFATPSFATPTELDKKTVASKAYVDTKQDIIETGLVNYYSVADEETKQVPSLVSYDSTNGLNGNQIGILDYENTSNDGFWTLTGSEMDKFVPTVRAVAGVIKRLNWYNYITTYTSAINAYNTTFGTGTNQWAGNSNHLINGEFLAKSLALKQKKIDAGTAGNVVTYSGTAGTVSSRGVYNDPSSEYFDNSNINDNELITVNAAAAIVDYVDARTPEITCAGVEPGTNECWLWTIPTYTTTTRPLPRGGANVDVWVTGYTSKASCTSAIRNNTSFTSLSAASNVVNNAPTRVATGLTPTAASNLVSTLVSGGCTAEIRNP